MAVKPKPKPKSNRAKFTIEKKAEKPKAKIESEAPKKEKKPEVVEEPQVELSEKQQEEQVTAPIPHQPEAAPTEQPAGEEQTQTETPEIPTNPFSVSMPTIPEHPSPELHESPFPPAVSSEQHPMEQSAEPLTEQSAQPAPLENSELSSTLPKEDTTPHQESSFSQPVEVETNSKGKGIIIYFVIVAFIAFLVGIGSMALFTFGFGKMGGLPHLSLPHFMAKATPTPVKTAKVSTPTPVPTKAVDLSAYNIKILNGSGVTGAASKLKTELTTDGFTVVASGNADKSDYTDTIIAVKKDINPDYLNKLKEVLKKEFSLGQDTQLSDTEAKSADVVITIGSTSAK